ncbi:hypothetical protein Tco_0921907 [Tanacetum coccineum]
MKRCGQPESKSTESTGQIQDEYKILDEEYDCQKQGVHSSLPETAKEHDVIFRNLESFVGGRISRRRQPVTEEEPNRDQAKMEIEILVPVESIPPTQCPYLNVSQVKTTRQTGK